MIIRKYLSEDLVFMIELFKGTVHEINKQDYSQEQLNTWAPEFIDKEKWKKRFDDYITYVAVDYLGNIIGFANISSAGYLDMLYVHKDHQGEGIGSKLVQELEAQAIFKKANIIETDASITARTFFEKHGYRVEKEQKVIRNGVEFINYKMKKRI